MNDSEMTNITDNEIKNRIKVCIVDDNKSYMDSLRLILKNDPRIIIYREYESGKQFVHEMLSSPFRPDVCLVDVVLNDMTGTECCKIVKEKYPEIHMIIMTAYPKISSMNEATQIGADYIEKGPRIERLLNNIITSFEPQKNERIISINDDEDYTTIGLKIASLLKESIERLNEISETQLKILKMRKQGMSISDIAKELKVGEATVNTHIYRAMKKLNLPNLLDYIGLV